MYHHYKPLRNLLRRYALRPCLQQLWHIFQHVHSGLPSPYRHRSLRDFIHPWELNILARELMLNASETGSRTFHHYNHLVDAINGIKAVNDRIQEEVLDPDNVMDEMSAIAHLQFPWQNRSAKLGMLRYWRLLSAPEVAAIVQRVMRVDIRTLYQVGLPGGGELLRQSWVDARRDLQPVAITPDAVARFYVPISTTVEALRARTLAEQRYDRNWYYTWNPLEATPLIMLDPAQPQRLTAPVPEFQLRAFAQGIYYALVNEPGFGNAFGAAFEAYVGDVLHRVFPGPIYKVRGETPYRVAKGKDKHGTDWIVSDRSAHLFIECKTKRVTLNAKMAGDAEAILAQLKAMAKFLVQLYKNIHDAQQGLTAWRPDGLPIYPVVLTLEDWHLFTPATVQQLDAMVLAGLQQAGLSAAVLQDMPYTVASAEDFISGALTASALGLEAFFREKNSAQFARWLMRAYVLTRHAETAARVHERLFWEDLKEILPYEGVADLPARG